MIENIESTEVINNRKNHRFEIRINGDIAIVPYNFKDDMIGLFRTKVPEKFRGKGLGTKLAVYALDYAKDHHLKKLAVYALNYAKDHHLKILAYCPHCTIY